MPSQLANVTGEWIVAQFPVGFERPGGESRGTLPKRAENGGRPRDISSGPFSPPLGKEPGEGIAVLIRSTTDGTFASSDSAKRLATLLLGLGHWVRLIKVTFAVAVCREMT